MRVTHGAIHCVHLLFLLASIAPLSHGLPVRLLTSLQRWEEASVEALPGVGFLAALRHLARGDVDAAGRACARCSGGTVSLVSSLYLSHIDGIADGTSDISGDVSNFAGDIAGGSAVLVSSVPVSASASAITIDSLAASVAAACLSNAVEAGVADLLVGHNATVRAECQRHTLRDNLHYSALAVLLHTARQLLASLLP